MRRREFTTLLAGAVAAWPLAARAQQPATRVRRIAVLLRVADDDPDAQRDLQNFRKGLWELGWTAGSNILMIYGSRREEACSAMAPWAPVMSRPRQDDFRCIDPASVKGALRSVPRKFDTRPVSMNLHHPAAIDFPEKSDAVTMHQGRPPPAPTEWSGAILFEPAPSWRGSSLYRARPCARGQVGGNSALTVCKTRGAEF
jgi:hypothetical protein